MIYICIYYDLVILRKPFFFFGCTSFVHKLCNQINSLSAAALEALMGENLEIFENSLSCKTLNTGDI